MPINPLQTQLAQGALSTLNTLNPFAGLQPGFTDTKPLPGETPFAYNHRMSVLNNARAAERGLGAAGREMGKAGSYLFGNEQQEQQRRTAARPATAASTVFPQSFTDPKWDELESRYGDLAPMLKAIRTQGERTNYGPQGDPRYQNPRTGAYTPYQITSSTRDLFRNRGQGAFDPWSSPENAVAAAAQVLRDHGGAANPRAAVAGYFGGGAAARNPFSTTMGDGNLNVAQYVDRVLYGGGGQQGALRSPFDAGYLNQANAQLDSARQAAMTPTTNVFPGEPMPQMPKPAPVPKSDFSAAEGHLEALRPAEFTEAEGKKLMWGNFWSGLGQAMASSPEGEGLGSFFLRLGGGALAASGKTTSEIQARKDAYDIKLAKFNAALYEHDMAKAQTVHNELVADWTANQNWVQNDYQQKLGIWQSNSKVQLVGDRLINQRINPTSGQVTVTTTPVASLIMADDARDRANISMQAFGTQNSANAQVSGIGNRIQGQIILGQAAQVLADENATDAERSAAAAYGPLPIIKYAVDTGQLAGVLGEDSFEALNEEVMTTLSGMGLMPGTKEYTTAAREAMIGRMIALTQQSPEMFQRLNQAFGAASSLYSSGQRDERTREQVRTKSGNTTYTRTIEEE